MNEKAFKVLYKEYSNMVYNVSLNYLQNTSDAQEITQDVFVKLFQKVDSFESRSKIKTWIYRITINACHDFIRKKKRLKRFGLHISLNSASPNNLHSNNHPGVKLENKEATKRIFENINKLPEKQKKALLLKSMEHLPIAEIAEIMETTPKSIESLLSRARANLKKFLNESKDSL